MKLAVTLLIAVSFAGAAEAQTLQIGTVGELQSFKLHSVGSSVDEYVGNKFSANWALDFSQDNEGVYKLSGPISINNLTTEAIRLRILVDMPLKEPLDGITYGGFNTIKLTGNADGATLSCGGLSFAVAPARNAVALPKAFFYCPFLMSMSGAGTGSTSQIVGLPLGSVADPKKATSMGLISDIELSSGDKVTLTSSVMMDGN